MGMYPERVVSGDIILMEDFLLVWFCFGRITVLFSDKIKAPENSFSAVACDYG